ncbi:hypothetical protein GCM10023199_41910 [Actinomycetospora chibensis]
MRPKPWTRIDAWCDVHEQAASHPAESWCDVPEQPEQPERPEPRKWPARVTVLAIVAIPVATYVTVLLAAGGADDALPGPTAPPTQATPASVTPTPSR